ncbi:hypothetical protein [Paenibacillus xylanilyticus]|uniref:hypothetical protein n=1 Tax=Paenibacillus xylanilyticus TaxID=248903 RepID=UPI0039A033B5
MSIGAFLQLMSALVIFTHLPQVGSELGLGEMHIGGNNRHNKEMLLEEGRYT